MKKPPINFFKAKSIGSFASDVLSEEQEASVLGSTSKGIFIQTSSKWLVFLSSDRFQGPLTITLEGLDPTIELVAKGGPVHIASNSVSLPEQGIKISFDNSQVWKPPFPSTIILGKSDRYQELSWFANEILSKKEVAVVGSFLPYLLGVSNNSPSYPTNEFSWADILNIKDHIRQREAIPLARLLSHFLGSGPGLTPSADDFICGLVLSLNRWSRLLWAEENLRMFNQHLVEAAYKRTTSLSANLIECASLGSADERLIVALDSLVCGNSRSPEIIPNLLGWGNSSGVYAFVGMAVSLTV